MNRWAERSQFGDAVRVSLLELAAVAASPRCAYPRPAEAGWPVQYPHRDPSTTDPSYRSGLRRLRDYYTLCCRLQVGLLISAPEKTARQRHPLLRQSVLSSPICRAGIAKNGRISRLSRETRTGILCTSDWVAEGEGFEPPVRFPVQRFSRPPVSTTHTSLRTI